MIYTLIYIVITLGVYTWIRKNERKSRQDLYSWGDVLENLIGAVIWPLGFINLVGGYFLRKIKSKPPKFL